MNTDRIRWGIVGCGDVAEVKSGPGFHQAEGSALMAVMRRDPAKAEDFARRHGVPRVHASADELIADPEVDAVYIATPPSSHCELAMRVAAAGKPCLVEKPMATNHPECLAMVRTFQDRQLPLWVAYYRRALPRFLEVRRRLQAGAIGRITSVEIHVTDVLPASAGALGWRVDPAISGAGLFFDLGSHCLDLVDFLIGPIRSITGVALNTGGAYAPEDAVAASFRCGDRTAGTGLWNFHADRRVDTLLITGSEGAVTTPIFTDGDVLVSGPACDEVLPIRNPPHVHQPLIQTMVDELRGRGRCESTGESGARASWALEQCVREYYDSMPAAGIANLAAG
jgi:1,5-anhydro-D-fructose reductase (1,5-anhydro-D-mannitol-forming)